MLRQPPLPSVTKILKGKTRLPVTRRKTMVLARFFEGALPPNTGTGRARISSRTAQGQREREPFIRAIRHQGVRSRHAPYSTNPTYHPARTNKHSNTRNNEANTQWSLQPWTGHRPHQATHKTPSGWSFDVFCVKLGEDHTRPLDSSHNSRLQTRIYKPPGTQSAILAASARDGESTSPIKRGGEVSTEGSHLPSSSRGQWLCEPNLCSTQVGRIMATCDKFKITQPICEGSPFQNGIHNVGEGLDSGRRLVNKTRPERCLSHSSSTSGPSEIPEVPMARSTVAVQSPSLWVEQCTVHLHQTYEADSSFVEEIRNTGHPVFGRHAFDGKNPKRGKSQFRHGSIFANFTGFHCEHGKEHRISITADGVPRFQIGFTPDDDYATNTEGSVAATSGEIHEGCQANYSQGNIPDIGINGGCPPSYSPSSTSLQTTREDQIILPQTGLVIRRQCTGLLTHEIRAVMVDRQAQIIQWTALADQLLGPYSGIRCFQIWLGSQLSRCEHGWSLDRNGAGSPHQLLGAESSLFSTANILLRENRDLSVTITGQHYSNNIHKQDGRKSLLLSFRSDGGDLELVHRSLNHYSCRAPSRHSEYSGRLGKSSYQRFQRLEAGQEDFPMSGGETGNLFNRLICLQDKQSATSVLQLETGSGSHGNRCSINPLDGTLPLHVSSICPDLTMLDQVTQGENFGSTNCPSVAQSDMVCTASEQPDGPADSLTPNATDCDQLSRPEPSSGSRGALPTSRLACIRGSSQARGLSDRVIDIIRKSWRTSTESSYSSAWRQWDCWCIERNTDPFSAPLKDILEFLCEQFNMGKQYRTINTLRSAISMTHEEVDGARIGEHPLVSRFLKGVYNSRPPAPRYSNTWDVDVILTYLSNLPANEDLSFQSLTHKVAMLMALSNADRCSDLVALDLNFRSFQPDGVLFIIPGLTKSRRSGPPIKAFYPSFTEDPKLCPVKALRSSEFRIHTSTRNPLFISVRRPFRPVKAATIGHWLKDMLKAAGINTSIFSAHSTRSAATSKAKATGVPMSEILKVANWSSSSTFCRFYNRTISPVLFGQAVLRNGQHNDGEL